MRLFVAVLVIFALAVTAQADTWDDWYGMLEARAGWLYNIDSGESDVFTTAPVIGYRAATGELGVEWDIDPDTEERGVTAGVFGVTFRLTGLQDYGVTFSWARYFEVNAGPYVRYEFEDREWSGGVMVSIVNASFDQGNVDRHARR